MQSYHSLRTAARLSVATTRSHLWRAAAPPPNHQRFLCAKPDGNLEQATPKQPNSLLSRLLSTPDGKRNRILSALGYYSAESRAIGAGNELYKQALQRAEAAAAVEGDGTKAFAPRYEMLSVHVYLILRRLRAEKGSEQEAEVKIVMQCLFDLFWTDVRKRMMMEENGLKLLQSAKWIKDCERRFFGMALSFDESWGRDHQMRESISRNIACLHQDELKVERFRQYVERERNRLDALMLDQLYEGVYKNGKYPSPPHSV
eukprot:GFKZ01006382.1.p1 GENE.GFKZ01006382.1~~GFKZ01006382.1.p1  ORF type:complete len:259 (-),score=34.74 GFKZ01006382.1:363-1139(-)